MGEHSKESSRWLRDFLSRFHNSITQTQRLSGTLAVMAKAIGKAYFMRQRFLLYRISCRGMQKNGGTSRKSYRVFGAFSWSWCSLSGPYSFGQRHRIQVVITGSGRFERSIPNMRRGEEMALWGVVCVWGVCV